MAKQNQFKKHFVKGYCKRSKISQDYFNKHMIALRCYCGAHDCAGWTAVNNDPLSIRAHLQVNGTPDINGNVAQ